MTATLFGSSIASAIARSSYTTPSGFTVPAVLARIYQEIESKGLGAEGIFRKSGSAVAMNKLQAQLEENEQPFTIVLPTDLPIHTFTGLFKRYLQQLPEPVIPKEHQGIFLDIFDEIMYTSETIKRKLKDACKNLPHEHLHLLQYLIDISHQIQLLQDDNQMSVENLAIIFAPTCVGLDASPLLSAPQSAPNSEKPSPSVSRKSLPDVLQKHFSFSFNAQKFVINLLKKKPHQDKLHQRESRKSTQILQHQLVKDSQKWIRIFEFMMKRPEVFAAISNPLNSQKYSPPMFTTSQVQIEVTTIGKLKKEPLQTPSKIILELELPLINEDIQNDNTKDEISQKTIENTKHMQVDFSGLDYKESSDFLKKFDDLLLPQQPECKITKLIDIKPIIQKFENIKFMSQ